MSGGNEKFEREFEDFLNEEDSRLAALYRKLPQPEPDARLDAAVRAMAHRALNPQLVATPRDASLRRRARWVPALGAAAGIVLAAGIAYRLGPSLHNEGEYAPASDVITVRQLDAPAPATEPPLSPPPPPVQSEHAAAAPASQAAGANLQGTPTTPAAAAPAARVADLREKEEGQVAQPQGNAGAGTLAKTGSAKDAPAPQAFPAPAKARKRASEMDAVERKQIMAAGAWQNLHDRDADEAARSELKAKAPDDKAPAPTANAAAAQASRAVSGSAATAPGPATVAAPPPPAAPAAESPAPAEYQFKTSPPSAAPGSRSDAAPASPADAAAGGPAPAAGLAKPAQAETSGRLRSNDPNAGLYPEHWVANIRTMLKEGRRDEALRSLAEFRRMYPDYHLPDDLRDLK